jgi:hypothetical protein
MRRAGTGVEAVRPAVADRGDRPTTMCEICVRGELDPQWSSWFDGLRVECTERGLTVLVGSVADQAALHGLLTRIRDLGLPLVSLRVTDEPAQPA